MLKDGFQWLGEESYSVEVMIFGEKQKRYCVHTCDKVCGRACKREKGHTERCDCLTDCASDVGPFDHLVTGVPQPIAEHDTEEVLSEFERDVTTKTG